MRQLGEVDRHAQLAVAVEHTESPRRPPGVARPEGRGRPFAAAAGASLAGRAFAHHRQTPLGSSRLSATASSNLNEADADRPTFHKAHQRLNADHCYAKFHRCPCVFIGQTLDIINQVCHKLLISLALPRGLEPLFSP
jgi:hypothetical protein